MAKAPIDSLMDELRYRAKYYYAGFGALMCGSIRDNAEDFTIEPQETTKTDLENAILTMMQLYDAIDTDELRSHPDADLLLPIKGIIPKLAEESRRVLSGTSYYRTRIGPMVKEIIDKGNDYSDRLKVIQERIESITGRGRSGFSLTDIDGRVWDNYNF